MHSVVSWQLFSTLRENNSISLLLLPPLRPHHVQTDQSVYGLAEEGTQSQSPIHTPSHHCRKGTKEDVEKEVKIGPNCVHCWRLKKNLCIYNIDGPPAALYTLCYKVTFCKNSAVFTFWHKGEINFHLKTTTTSERKPDNQKQQGATGSWENGS